MITLLFPLAKGTFNVHSSCIWPDTLCISVHLYEKYAILVIINKHIFSIFYLFLVHAKPPTRAKKF